MNRLKILMVNRSMHAISGTELYTRDLALELKKQNHLPQVFTPTPGVVSDQLIAAGIEVVSEIEQLNVPPDIVHGHHAWTTMAVLARFPSVPAVFVGHDAAAWTDIPPQMAQVRRYIAVDQAVFRRFTNQCSLPDEKVRIVPNAIDFTAFERRGPLPSRPTKALLISNYSGPTELAEIQAACDARQIKLDAVGRRFGNMTSHPEKLYANYDLVFAKGRCLLEAAAAGCAVIYCDTLGCGPMMSSAVLAQANGMLAGRELMNVPLERQALLQRIDEFDAADAQHVSRIIRNTYNARHVAGQLIEIYREAIAGFQTDTKLLEPNATEISLANELLRWSQNAEEIFRNHQKSMAQLLPDEQVIRDNREPSPGFRSGNTVSAKGWYPREKDAAGSLWWLGPEPNAWIDLEVPHIHVTHLRSEVAHAMDPDLLRGLRILINGNPAKLQFSIASGPAKFPVIWAKIPDAVIPVAGKNLRATFTIDRTIRPCDVTLGSLDQRRLGIAFRDIALTNPDSFVVPNAAPLTDIADFQRRSIPGQDHAA